MMDLIRMVGPRIVKLKSKLVYFLSFVLIVSGIIDFIIILHSRNLEGMGPMVGSLIASMKMIMGFCILFDPRKNLLRAVGFYAFALGFNRLLVSFPYLTNSNQIYFVVGIVFVGMSCNLMYSGINYLNETSRSRTGMVTTTSLMALLQIALLAFMYKTEVQAPWEKVAPYVVSLFQYITLLIIMDTEELRFGSSLEKSNTRIESVRVIHSLERDLKINESDAMTLLRMMDDRSDWEPVEDGGPVECEKRLRIVDKRIPSVMIMQKWRDSEKIHVTMINNDVGSIIAANRFSVTDVVPENDTEDFRYLRFFDDGRMISQIWVNRQEAKTK